MTAETNNAHEAAITKKAHQDAADIQKSSSTEDAYKKFKEDLSGASHSSLSRRDKNIYDVALSADLTKPHDGKPAILPELKLMCNKEHAADAKQAESSQTKSDAGHLIKKGETLWSIAKKDLPDGATPQQIDQHAREIAKANNIADLDRIREGKTIKVDKGDQVATADSGKEAKESGSTKVSTQADGSTVVENATGTKTTTWHGADGDSVKVENKDGSGYTKSPDKSEHHWGPKPEDNYDIPAGAGKTVVKEGDKTTTTWTDDKGTTVRVENKDGTGYIRNPDGSVHHWGPNAQDNYDQAKDGSRLTKQADGSTVSESKDGTKTTTWHGDNGDTVKVENKDGTGYVRNPDKSEHHWGPNDEDNYDVPAGDGKAVTINGDRTTTTWTDANGTTVKVENKDGTGFVRNPDGSVHHWGPNPQDNYDRTKDGSKVPTQTQADGSTVVESADGTKTTTWHGTDGDTVKVENKDATGYVRSADKSEHHWGPKDVDNYDIPAGDGKTVVINGDRTTTTWTDDKGTTVKVENKDGTGFVRNPDGSIHHWGPNAADNYNTTPKK